MILVSPTEPDHVKALGKTSSAPETYGCDLLVTTRRRKLGIQRKKFPEDLIASVEDGRLADQLVKMAELDRACVVMVGYPAWTRDGTLVHSSWSKREWTFASIWGAVASISFEAGVPVMWVRDETEFGELVGVLDEWNRREKHSTIRTRSRPRAKGWGVSTKTQQAHFLQGLPGCGPETAERIVDAFEGLPMAWTCTVEEMMEVRGVGRVKAERMGEMVRYRDG